MDVSPEYIAQCDCPEIQAQFKCVNGDLIYLKRVPEICASDDVDNPLVIGTSVFLHPCDDYCIQIGFDDETFVSRDEFIWLPRQDDLQKMVTGIKLSTMVMGLSISHTSTFVDYLPSFMRFAYEWDFHKKEVILTYRQPFNSMEQLWLAFVMKELHQKQWNGTNWE